MRTSCEYQPRAKHHLLSGESGQLDSTWFFRTSIRVSLALWYLQILLGTQGPHVRKPIEIQGSFEERPLWNPVGSIRGFPCGSAGKESACNAGDLGSIPELGRSPGEGKGYLLQYSGLENSMDCIVHGVANSRTRLNDFHFQALSDQQKGSKKIC